MKAPIWPTTITTFALQFVTLSCILLVYYTGWIVWKLGFSHSYPYAQSILRILRVREGQWRKMHQCTWRELCHQNSMRILYTHHLIFITYWKNRADTGHGWSFQERMCPPPTFAHNIKWSTLWKATRSTVKTKYTWGLRTKSFLNTRALNRVLQGWCIFVDQPGSSITLVPLTNPIGFFLWLLDYCRK